MCYIYFRIRKKTFPYKTVRKIIAEYKTNCQIQNSKKNSPKIVEKTVPLLEVMIVSEDDK